MLKYTFSLICLICIFRLDAQVEIIEFERDSTEQAEYELEEWVELMEISPYRIGISPSAILNAFPALQISQDFKLTDYTELSVETGFVFATGLLGKGFRVRASVESYLFRWEHAGIFVGAAATNVNVWEYIQYSIMHENTYWREYEDFRTRVLLAGYLTGGFKFHLGRGVMLETSAALGLGSLYNEPLESVDQQWIWTFYPSDPGWNLLPGFYTNLNLSMPVDISPITTKVKNTFSSKKKKKKKKKKRKRRR